VLSDFVLGVNGTYRKMYDLVELAPEKTPGAGDFYTQADYELVETVTGTIRNGGPSFSVDIYDLRAGIDAPTYFVFRNRPDYSQEYLGLELSATKRMSRRWMLRGSFTWQDWTQNVGEDAFSNPTRIRDSNGNCSNCDGDQVVQGSGTGSGAKGGIFINSKWAYNVTGAYQIPVIETSLGFNLTGRQGYPIRHLPREHERVRSRCIPMDRFASSQRERPRPASAKPAPRTGRATGSGDIQRLAATWLQRNVANNSV
jgi:hypothetical protein